MKFHSFAKINSGLFKCGVFSKVPHYVHLLIPQHVVLILEILQTRESFVAVSHSVQIFRLPLSVLQSGVYLKRTLYSSVLTICYKYVNKSFRLSRPKSYHEIVFFFQMPFMYTTMSFPQFSVFSQLKFSPIARGCVQYILTRGPCSPGRLQTRFSYYEFVIRILQFIWCCSQGHQRLTASFRKNKCRYSKWCTFCTHFCQYFDRIVGDTFRRSTYLLSPYRNSQHTTKTNLILYKNSNLQIITSQFNILVHKEILRLKEPLYCGSQINNASFNLGL